MSARPPAPPPPELVLRGMRPGDAGGLQRFAGRQAHAAGLGMGVHDAFTGRGIGAALIGAMLDAADNWLALRRIELTVFPDNAPAIRLYERHGFVREGLKRQDAFRAGAYVDSLLMARLRQG